jgi:hypothetical protein
MPGDLEKVWPAREDRAVIERRRPGFIFRGRRCGRGERGECSRLDRYAARESYLLSGIALGILAAGIGVTFVLIELTSGALDAGSHLFSRLGAAIGKFWHYLTAPSGSTCSPEKLCHVGCSGLDPQAISLLVIVAVGAFVALMHYAFARSERLLRPTIPRPPRASSIAMTGTIARTSRAKSRRRCEGSWATWMQALQPISKRSPNFAHWHAEERGGGHGHGLMGVTVPQPIPQLAATSSLPHQHRWGTMPGTARDERPPATPTNKRSRPSKPGMRVRFPPGRPISLIPLKLPPCIRIAHRLAS